MVYIYKYKYKYKYNYKYKYKYKYKVNTLGAEVLIEKVWEMCLKVSPDFIRIPSTSLTPATMTSLTPLL